MLCQMTLCLAEQFEQIVSFGIMTKINGIFNKRVKDTICARQSMCQFLCFALNKKVCIMLLRDKLESDSQRQNIMFYPPNMF